MIPAFARCVALVGFRASGKSVLGALLAQRLRRPFFDLDREIEMAQGRSVSRLFAEEGEPGFRAIERETLAGVLARPGIVLAPGGGIVLDPVNVRRLQESACTIFLDVPWQALARRLALGAPRPALTALPFEDEVRTLVTARAPLYGGCADFVLTVGSDESESETFHRLENLVGPIAAPRR